MFCWVRNVGLVNGIGFGLYIVKYCVDMYEGIIEFESVVGNGMIVIINLFMFFVFIEFGLLFNIWKGDDV